MSGSGVSGRSQASVHAERKNRACLPVMDLVRTVSSVPAASSFCLAMRSSSDSAVVSQTDSAPHTLGAERQGRGHLSPAAYATGAEYRGRGNGIDNFRDQHHTTNLSGVSSSFVGLGDNHVHTRGFVALGVLFLTSQGADVETARMGRLSHPIRRCAERTDQKPSLVLKRNIHDTLGLFLGVA